jgi:hypothetical protein
VDPRYYDFYDGVYLMSYKFESVKTLVRRIIRVAEHNDCVIMYDGVVIKPEQLVLTDDQFFIQMDNCSFCFYWDNPEYDEGYYTDYREIEKSITSQIRLFTEHHYV